MKKFIAVLLSLCVGVSFLAVGAHGGPRGCTTPALPWEREFEEYGTIFIMTPPGWPDYCGCSPGWPYDCELESGLLWERWGHYFDEERMQIRSGLYYNTDPLVSIYYIDEYFFQRVLFFADGGRYFVHVSDGTLGTLPCLNREMLRFFANGELVTSYRMGELARRRDHRSFRRAWRGGFMGGFLPWIERGTLEHDQQAGTLSLVTTDGRAYTFDLTTGEIIYGRTINRRLETIGIVMLAAAVIFRRRLRRIFLDRK